MLYFSKSLRSTIITLRSSMSHMPSTSKCHRGPRNQSRQGHENQSHQRHGNHEEGESRGKHPPHLKGKEIGLYYAKKAKKAMEEEQNNPRPLGVILLSQSKREQIKQLLASSTFLDTFFILDDGSYDHIRDSTFKRDFMRVIHGNIEDKLNVKALLKKNDKLDVKLQMDLENKIENNNAYQCMMTARKKLPAYKKEQEILELLEHNQVLVISGETGCGKTTQVAQFILDDYIRKGNGSLCRIVCTQPRRISAVSVATRVASERAEPLGISVGYQIRLERKFPRDRGSMCFCTTGVLLKQMETNPCLTDYSHLILDEIHERDVMSDFLITIIKQLITHRKDLKIILMSATLNSEKFSKYFDNCPQITIPGFTYPVVEYYLEDVIERTRFEFEVDRRSGGFKKRKQSRSQRNEEKEYSDFIEPYVRQLERERTYSRNTCIQLRNPMSENINLDLIMALIIDICRKEADKGAILVFLTGYMEISKLYTRMEESGKFPKGAYLILPLHSQMPTVDQKQIFERPPSGTRKIILSTNIAETSVTIDDVVFVIDCGKIKINNFNLETKIQTLLPEWVSLANADQRKGRAGRVQPGVCFHLFTRARRMILEKYLKPEILRTRLEDVLLMMKILQLGKAEPFFAKLLDPPDPAALAVSLDLLKQLNALDDSENLTPLGYHLGKLPVGPQMGKMMLMGAIFGCLNPVLSVAAFLDFKDAFQLPLGKERIVDEKKLQLSNGQQSDHLLFCEAMRRFESLSDYERRRFCWEYFLSQNTMNLLSSMKKQFMEYLYELNFVPNTDPYCRQCNTNSDNFSLIKAIICAGLYPNVLIGRPKKNRFMFKTPEGVRVDIHPKSILSSCNRFESPFLVYFLKMRSTSIFVHDATVVHALPLVFFGDQYNQQETEGGHKVLSISDRIRFKCSEATALTIKELRDRLNWFMEYKISHPGVVDWNANGEEIKVLRAIMELITSEDLGDMDLDDYDDYD